MRVRKSLERKTGFRDGRMIIIATEGSVTEVSYFTQLNDAAILSSNKFQIKVIPLENNRSSPNHILRSLTNFKREYQIKGDDELWMVIDRDRWTIQMLSDIISQCKQKGIGFCISNPCFEIWLILHFEDLVFPFKGKGCYIVLGKVVEDFGFPSLEVSKMEKLPWVKDGRY